MIESEMYDYILFMDKKETPWAYILDDLNNSSTSCKHT